MFMFVVFFSNLHRQQKKLPLNMFENVNWNFLRHRIDWGKVGRGGQTGFIDWTMYTETAGGS